LRCAHKAVGAGGWRLRGRWTCHNSVARRHVIDPDRGDHATQTTYPRHSGGGDAEPARPKNDERQADAQRLLGAPRSRGSAFRVGGCLGQRLSPAWIRSGPTLCRGLFFPTRVLRDEAGPATFVNVRSTVKLDRTRLLCSIIFTLPVEVQRNESTLLLSMDCLSPLRAGWALAS
jgi:hypothetical protein